MSAGEIRLRAAPPFLMSAGLVLWGWQTGYLVYALPMALLLELSYWVKWRWPITDKEFNVVSDVSGLIFFVLVVYIFTKEGAGGIYNILAIMPFVLYLLILLQRYSVQGTIRLSVLFISLRRLEPDPVTEVNREIDLSLPYLLLCMVSASAGNRFPVAFFLICCLLISLVLWSLRPARYHPFVWAALLAVSLSAAWAGQIGIRHAQRSVEMMLMEIFEKYMWRYRDPDRASTAIGSLGRLKLSDRILLRVDTEQALDKPLLLREASYTNYGFGVWSNVDNEFELIDPDITPDSWTLQPVKGEHTAAVSSYKIEEISVAPLPHGATRIHGISAFDINRNRYGAIRMETKEGWIKYQVDYNNDRVYESPPNEYDLSISENYRPTFNQLVDKWNLDDKKPEEIIKAIERNFAGEFSYSLDQGTRYPRGRYLHHFLFDSKQGHCEFFATSTVLALRAAGVPARYTVGYAVNEYSDLEDRYIVRARDSHSWAQAWVNGAWRVVDTTPSVWAPLADKNASALEPLFDFVAWFKYRFARWQSEDDLTEESTDTDFLLWLLPPLLIFLIWRLYNRERPGQDIRETKSGGKDARGVQGADSALYRLIARLERSGYARRPGETLGAWFHRIGGEMNADTPRQALALHYRYRFDPEADTAFIRTRLSETVAEILDSDQLNDR